MFQGAQGMAEDSSEDEDEFEKNEGVQRGEYKDEAVSVPTSICLILKRE